MGVTTTRQRVRFLVGLPGSGKTYQARQLEAAGWVAVDDPKIVDGRAHIEAAIKTGKDVVIADPHLCRVSAREAAQTFLATFDVEIEWVFFANDPETCWHNVQHRADDRAVSEMGVVRFSQAYSIPDGVTVLPVYKVGRKETP